MTIFLQYFASGALTLWAMAAVASNTWRQRP